MDAGASDSNGRELGKAARDPLRRDPKKLKRKSIGDTLKWGESAEGFCEGSEDEDEGDVGDKEMGDEEVR